MDRNRKIGKQSKLSEIVAPTITSTQKNKKNKRNRQKDFRISNQNQQSVKTKRDSRFHTSSNKERNSKIEKKVKDRFWNPDSNRQSIQA